MNAARRPSLKGLWVAGAIFLLTGAVSATWLILAMVGIWQDVRDFPRAEVPGTLRIEVDEPGRELVVYADEEERYSDFEPVRYGVTGPDGAAVDLGRYSASFTFSSGDRTVRAVSVFTPDAPGVYIVTAEGSSSPDRGIAVGPPLGRRLAVGIAGPFAVGVAGTALAAIIAVAVVVRRVTAPKPAYPYGRSS